MQRRQRQDRDLAAMFVCLLSEAQIPPLCLCLCQCPLAVVESLGSSSRSVVSVGFTFTLLRTPDAALCLAPVWAESCKTNLYGLPPLLSLPPYSDSSPVVDLRLPLSLCLNHIQMARLESERKNERGREKEWQTDRQTNEQQRASVPGTEGRFEADSAYIQTVSPPWLAKSDWVFATHLHLQNCGTLSPWAKETATPPLPSPSPSFLFGQGGQRVCNFNTHSALHRKKRNSCSDMQAHFLLAAPIYLFSKVRPSKTSKFMDIVWKS